MNFPTVDKKGVQSAIKTIEQLLSNYYVHWAVATSR